MAERKGVPVQDILKDIKAGLGDEALRNKYGLSQNQLEDLFKKLITAGRLTQADLDGRQTGDKEMIYVEPDPPQEPPKTAPRPSAGKLRHVSYSNAEVYSRRAKAGMISGVMNCLVGAVVSSTGPDAAPFGSVIFLLGSITLVW